MKQSLIVGRARMGGLVALTAAAIIGMAPAIASAATTSTCSVSVSDPYAKAVLADGPIAYYRLDDAAGSPMCDASTQANDGTYAASGVTYGVPGALLKASDASVTANGTSGDIGDSDSNAALSGNSSFTYEAWFRSTGTVQSQALVDVGTSGNGNIAGLTTWPNSPNDSTLGLDEYAGSNVWDTTTAGVNIYDGAWHYLVITYNATTDTVTGYADAHDLGAQTPNTNSKQFNLQPSPVRVGNWIDTVVNQPFNGGLDEVAVYPTALSSKRVLAHYKAAGYVPRVTSVSPRAGATAGGNTVTITGTGFANGSRVKFGSTSAASVTYVSPTELQAVAPAHTAGTVAVTVSDYVGTSAKSNADLYAFGAPSVVSISPTSGPTTGGTTVTITGSGFVPGTSVDFGTTAAKKVTFVSPTKLKAVSPAEPSGSVDVTATTAAGTSATSAGDVFTFGVSS